MGSRQMELDQVSRRLTPRDLPAWVDVALLRSGDGWTLRHLRGVVGTEPPGWVEAAWRYEEAAFFGLSCMANELAPLWQADDGRLTLGDFQFTLPERSLNVASERRPSYARYDNLSLPWPTQDFRIGTTAQMYNAPIEGFLVSTDAPTFTDFSVAFKAFFHGDYSPTSTFSLPTDLAVVRTVEDEVHFGEIHVQPLHVDVEVRGRGADGAVLEMFSERQRAATVLEKAGTTRFPLEDGLSPGTWFWLKRGTEWLDYRPVGPPWATADESARAGVRIDLPNEPDSAIEAMISGGEGPEVEFKSILPSSADTRRTTFKTVAAFANGGGGTILFGVDPDEMTVVGVDGGDLPETRDQLGNLVRARVQPSPQFRVTQHVIQGVHVLALRIEPGESPPYGISVDKASADRPEFYVRRGASTFHAQPADLRAATIARPGTPPAQPRGLFG